MTPGQRLRAMMRSVGLRKVELARAVQRDPSMITYVCGNGRPSIRTAEAIMNELVAYDKSLKVEAHMWMLSLGFAPACLRAASEERMRAALEAVGVREPRKR